MEYSDYLRKLYGEGKIQKISVNAGMSCPNRDGRIGIGGCIYCNNESFSPHYCMNGTKSIREQLENGKAFFARKYPTMRYLAYFQSFTNTYSESTSDLEKLYREALDVENVTGLVIGTRPDTCPDDVLDILTDINRRSPVILEFGAESSSNCTLAAINRGHTWEDTTDAVNRAHAAGISCGVHLIAGLPGESRQRSLQSVKDVCSLPIDTLKLHQLQIIKNTPLEHAWRQGELNVEIFELDEYLDFCRQVVDIVPDHIVIERFLAQAPPEMVIAPKWGIKNYEFRHRLQNLCRSAHNPITS